MNGNMTSVCVCVGVWVLKWKLKEAAYLNLCCCFCGCRSQPSPFLSPCPSISRPRGTAELLRLPATHKHTHKYICKYTQIQIHTNTYTYARRAVVSPLQVARPPHRAAPASLGTAPTPPASQTPAGTHTRGVSRERVKDTDFIEGSCTTLCFWSKTKEGGSRSQLLPDDEFGGNTD